MKSSNGEDIYSIDWETCQIEIQTEFEAASKRQIEENEKRKQEQLSLLKKNFEEEYNKKKIEMQEQVKKQVEEYQKQLKELNENAEKQKIEQERLIQEKKLKEKLEQLEEEKARKKREFEIREKNEMMKIAQAKNDNNYAQKMEKMEKSLMNILKKMTKIKIIIAEFKRNINIEVILQKNFINPSEINSVPIIIIRVENYEEGTVYYWNPETFHNRFDLIRELFDKYMDEDFDLNSLPKEDDPLWDEPEDALLGYAFYKLEPVAYLMSNKTELSIINPHTGKLMGYVEIDIIPHDINNFEFDEVPESPNELIGQSLYYKVVIHNVKKLPNNFCKNLRIEYQSFYDKSINYTKIYNQNENKKTEFDIEEEFEHKIDYLTKEDIEYLEKENVKFRMYAYEDVEKKGRIKVEEKRENVNKDNSQNVKKEIKRTQKENEKIEPDEPTEYIQKDGDIKQFNVNKNNNNNTNNYNQQRGRSGSQKFRKLKNLAQEDCSIF